MMLRESIKLKIGFRLSGMMALAAAVIWALSQSAFTQQGGTANYFYDANGRLKAVLSPTGEAAIYEYDPAGNFTSITRRAANELSIIEFTPGVGGVGAQVTIYGTGFSDIPSANTVKFNGAPATVTAATKIQLTVTVPAGATTGPINISNTNGSVNSSGNFFVPGNVEFVLPLAFDVLTPFSFNRPPSGQQLTNVGMLTFDGVAGQRVSLTVRDLDPCLFRTFPLDFVYAQMPVISPSGALITTVPLRNYFADVDPSSVTDWQPELGWLEPLVLPVTGKYTIVIDPVDNVFCNQPTFGFNGTARLHDVPPDITGTFIASVAPAPLVLRSTPGQNAVLTFSGLNGQRICFRGAQDVRTLLKTDVKVYSPGTYPSGTPMISGNISSQSPPVFFVDTTTLTASGTYTIRLDPEFFKTFGGAEFKLYDVPPDVTGTLTIYPTFGSSLPTTVNLSPGQNALLTFNVTSTQPVKVSVGRGFGTGVGGDPPNQVTASLLRSDDSLIISRTSDFAFEIPAQTLAPGTYKVKIDPHRANEGSVDVRLFNQ